MSALDFPDWLTSAYADESVKTEAQRYRQAARAMSEYFRSQRVNQEIRTATRQSQ